MQIPSPRGFGRFTCLCRTGPKSEIGGGGELIGFLSLPRPGAGSGVVRIGAFPCALHGLAFFGEGWALRGGGWACSSGCEMDTISERKWEDDACRAFVPLFYL